MAFNPKFKEREIDYETSIKSLMGIDHTRKVVWVHSASMGEFEQAKPVIEKIKSSDPYIQVVASFFSPSGYTNQKNYEFIDSAVYMPMDTGPKARKFIDTMAPDIGIFIRYDIWHNHLKYLDKKNVPSFLICATRPSSSVMRDFPVLSHFAGLNYGYFNRIYAVSDEDHEFFESIEYEGVLKQLPDTRFDRIIEKVENAKDEGCESVPNALIKDKFVIVAGSTWQTDEEMIISAYEELKPALKGKISLIIVPHEPNPENVSRLKKRLNDSILLSELKQLETIDPSINKHLIIDSIGILLSLYSVADAAYVGGGFRAGIHSITEPAGYGIALACGKKYKNSADAVRLKNNNALSIILNKDEMRSWMVKIIEYEEYRREIGSKVKNYIYNSQGSSRIVAEDIISCIKEEVKPV